MGCAHPHSVDYIDVQLLARSLEWGTGTITGTITGTTVKPPAPIALPGMHGNGRAPSRCILSPQNKQFVHPFTVAGVPWQAGDGAAPWPAPQPLRSPHRVPPPELRAPPPRKPKSRPYVSLAYLFRNSHLLVKIRGWGVSNPEQPDWVSLYKNNLVSLFPAALGSYPTHTAHTRGMLTALAGWQ